MGAIRQLGPRTVATAALLASLWCASAARAVTIEVVNAVDRPIEFGSTSSDCWNLYDLSPPKRGDQL